MFQPQVTSANSAAHYTGMLATFDAYRRREKKGNKEEVQAKHTSRLASFISSLASKFKSRQAADTAAKTA